MRWRTAALMTAAVGLGAVAYARWEATSYRLRQAQVPVLPARAHPLTILHLSDIHFVPGQHGKAEWLRSLASLQPDAVVVTGDFLAHDDAIPHVLDALDPLLRLPGAFVLGSNDYYAPHVFNPAQYLAGPSRLRAGRRMLPWPDLVAGLTSAGWIDLGNHAGELAVSDQRIDMRGVDDPHIGRDDYAMVAGRFDDRASVRLGVAHAPYLRVLDAMTADGADLILAGHTHGGQLCLPGVGALVTNCDLDRARAKGLSQHRSPDGAAAAYLHVSAGLGTSPYAPFRFACPPEATMLTLVPGAAVLPGAHTPTPGSDTLLG